MDFLFAYVAGLLTLINPCVLPVLPIVLVSALNVSRSGPVVLAAGMSLSFVVVGVLVSAFGTSIGLSQDRLSEIGAFAMVGFGVILVTPAFARRFELATAGLASSADQSINSINSTNLNGQFIAGLLLGAIWSPCIGPTLGGAIALASQGQKLGYATLVMSFFALGVSTLIIGLGMGARETLRNRAHTLRSLAEYSKPILGFTFIAIGTTLAFKIHHRIEAWALDVMPIWLQDLSVSF